MIITEETFKVTIDMMKTRNMVRERYKGKELAVPVNPLYPEDGLEWVNIENLQNDHYNRLEHYFAFLHYKR